MKICWDNLEKLKFTKNGNWKILGKGSPLYEKICKNCNEYFLGRKVNIFCSHECSEIGKFYPKSLKNYVKKIVIKKTTPKTKENHVNYGKFKENSSYWRGGKGKCWYNTYAPQISFCEEVRRAPDDYNILEVKCKYCGKWLKPTKVQINNRIKSINGKNNSENNFYCSKECKKACPIFWKRTITPNSKDELNKEVQLELRKLVLERDNYECQKCGYKSDTRKDKGLICHHINPVKLDPIESADIDNCITLCKECHKEVHKKDGCSIGYLANCVNE